jgi:PIN domain nuclease of toxin-antitoxin system
MSSSVVVDTHAAVWFRTEPGKLSAAAIAALDEAEANGEIYVSAITLVELRYLVDKGRVAPEILKAIRESLDDDTTAYVLAPLDSAVADATEHIARADVPDMPDRIIAATAFSLGLAVVARDGKIRTSGVATIW